MSSLVPPSLYAPIFQWVLFVLVLIMAARCKDESIYKSSIANSMSSTGKVLVLAITLIVGFRPVSGYFGDTVNYAAGFISRQASGQADFINSLFSFEGEFVFAGIQDFCVEYADIHTMFLIFALIFFICQFIACRRLLGQYWFAPFVAMAGMIDYWGFAVNGIRNGAAANLMILALTYGRRYSVSIPLAILAIGIHKSMILVGCAAILAHYYRKTKMYLAGWFTCIFLSAVAGNTTSNLLLTYLGGADDRMNNYLEYGKDASMMAGFSSSGFRVDFLLYSAVPIFVGYWYTQLQKVEDTYYKWWLNIYIISNSFWVLMMKAAFTNRFAALSWFTAGIVLMYPFFKYRFTHQQGRYASAAILCWYVFCFIQNIIRRIILT